MESGLRRQGLLVTAILLVGLSALVSAGTPESPEIEDPAGDSTEQLADLRRVWFDVGGDGDKFEVWLDLESMPSFTHLATCGVSPIEPQHAFRVYFRAFNGDQMPVNTARSSYVDATIYQTCVLFTVGSVDQNGTDPRSDATVGGVAPEDNHFYWVVDPDNQHVGLPVDFRSAGYSFREIWAASGPLWSSSSPMQDRAPDQGFGRNFTVDGPFAPAFSSAPAPESAGPPGANPDESKNDLPGSRPPARGLFMPGSEVLAPAAAVFLPVVGGGLGLLLYEPLRFRLLGLLTAPLFTRLQRDEVLESRRRALLLQSVQADPGVTFADLRRVSELGSGVLSHHLRVLERQGFLVARPAGFRTRFYVAGPRLANEPYLSATQRRLLEVIQSQPGINQKGLSASCGIPRKNVAYHVDRLVEARSVRLDREGKALRHYAPGFDGSDAVKGKVPVQSP